MGPSLDLQPLGRWDLVQIQRSARQGGTSRGLTGCQLRRTRALFHRSAHPDVPGGGLQSQRCSGPRPGRPPGLLRLLPLRGGGRSALRSLQVQKGQGKRSTGFRRPRLPGPAPARFPRHARRRSQRADFPRRPEKAARPCPVGAGRSAPLCLRACGAASRLAGDGPPCALLPGGPCPLPDCLRRAVLSALERLADSRGPFRALPLRPVRPCALRRAGFFRPLRRRGSTVRPRLGRRPVSWAAARLCSSIRPAGRLSAAGFPGAVGQLHAGQGAPALGRALLLGRTPLAGRRAAQGGGSDLPSNLRALCPGLRSALRAEGALSQGSSRLPRGSGRSLLGAARPLAGRFSPDRECSGRLSLRRQHAAVRSALGTLLPECQLCAGRRNIQLPAGRLPTA